MSRGEFQRIRDWLLPLAQSPLALADLQSQVVVGQGDDAFAVQPPVPLVISVDMAVAGTHFPLSASAPQVAAKALRSALSDLAAMGAKPWFYTLALQIPRSLDDQWWADFSAQLHYENERWGVQCLGGDLVAGDPLTLSVQVHGLAARPLLRSNAQVGDTLWVTGAVGAAAQGLAQILQGQTPEQPLLDAFYAPDLPLAWMQQAAPLINAAIDISDGLLADLEHLLIASAVGAEIHLEQLPISADLQPQSPIDWRFPLTGGEDYQVLFTAPESNRAELLASAAALAQPISAIGTIKQPPGVDLIWQGQPVQLPTLAKGYNHFV